MPQPTITVVSPLDAVGVRLLPFESPEFQATLPPNRDKTFDYLFQYSAMLSNNTNKSIIAYTILWICTDANGKVVTSVDAWFDSSAFPCPWHLSAHRSKFVSLLSSDEFDTPTVFSEAPPDLPFYTKQKTVQIVLSGILFDDGEAVGDDTRNWISRWRSRGLLNGRNDQGDLDYGSFVPASARSDKFEEQYALHAGFAAASLILRFDGVTESDMRDTIQKILAIKKYPEIKKKEF